MPTHRSTGEKSRREDESSVRGSHNDSYTYKMEEGLMKRTFSAFYGKTKWSVISYYDPDAVEAGMLRRVSDDPNLKHIEPRQEIVNKVLQGSASTSKDERRGSSFSHHLPSSSRDYEHVYELPHRPGTSSYSGQPMSGMPISNTSYSPSMHHGTTSYDQSPVTPIFQQSNPYTGPLPQTHYSSFSPSQTQPYAVNYQCQQNEQYTHIYHPQQQPVMDPRSYQEHAAQDRQDSNTQPPYAARPLYRQSSYHHESPSGFSPTRPDGQQMFGVWHAHDQKYYPPPPGARPN